MTTDLDALAGHPVVIGGGIAGMLTALQLAPAPVVLVSKAPLGCDSSSELAQGGIAASLGPDDRPALHEADTIEAGDGLCDPATVRLVTEAAADAIEALQRFGVRFDRGPDGRPVFGLEAAHSRRRVLHAAGDGTGRELMRALTDAVRRTPSVAVIERSEVLRLVLRNGTIAGAAIGGTVLATSRVVLATGGIGGLFRDTTNPAGSFGQGLALAARAGAELADLEFIQFHPTALDTPSRRPMPLISEAVRGEGAVVIDETGKRFLADIPGAELAPRDVVARAIATHLAKGHQAFIDARSSSLPFATRFPAIDSLCRAAGIDPAREPIPIRPTVHYHMGGIAVDETGRSSVEGLWAVGETACTGLHGANRLASNSLLEAAVFAHRVAENVADAETRPQRRPPDAGPFHASDPASIRPIVTDALGLARNGTDLAAAIADLLPLATIEGPQTDPAIAALMMAVAAFERRESRGAHCRSDFPGRSRARRRSFTLQQTLELAREIEASSPMTLARSA